MPARTSLLLTAVAAATAFGAQPISAQRAGPGNVTVTEMKGSVMVSWRGVRGTGVSYRVLRGADPSKPGMDLTKPLPSDATSFSDGPPAPGNTVFYTVVAVYGDGSEGASPPVQFTEAGAAPLLTATLPSRGAAPMPTATVSPRLTTGIGPRMAPPVALRATPVTAAGLWEATLSWPPVATTVAEPVSYQVRLLTVDPATQPSGAPVGYFNGGTAKLGSDGRMFVIDRSADMERPTWYSVVATSTTQGSVTFPWYRRDPPPHRGVDTITGAYWPEGALSTRHWVGCFTVSDVPSAVGIIGHMRVGASAWLQLVLPANHLIKFDTNSPGFHQFRSYFDAAGVLQIQMWPRYSSYSSMGPFVVDTAHVQQVVYNVPQVTTPWDLSKCAP